jgi:hypothetical protein
MDERLEKALSIANAMVTFNNQKELLKQDYKDSCLYHENGYRFTISRELINFLSSLIHAEILEDVVILDDFENPYMISNVKDFYKNIFNIYTESSNKYYHEFVKLKKNRSIEKIIGLDA